MQHTKEPWNGKNIPLTASALERVGFYIVFTNNPATKDEAEANARRIVACVNACAGISTETLEAMPAGPSAIERQREQLLAATQYAIARYPDLATDIGMIEALSGFKILCLVPQQN